MAVVMVAEVVIVDISAEVAYLIIGDGIVSTHSPSP